MKRFMKTFTSILIVSALALSLSCVTTTGVGNGTVNTSTLPQLNTSIINLKITDNNINILNGFNIESYYSVPNSSSAYKKLLYSSGKLLNVTNKRPDQQTDGIFTQLTDNAGSTFGECVSAVRGLVAQPSISAGGSNWIRGPRVMDHLMDGAITLGTVIATFTKTNDKNGSLEFDPSGNSHVAIYKGPQSNGFDVWDQNWDGHNEPNWEGMHLAVKACLAHILLLHLEAETMTRINTT